REAQLWDKRGGNSDEQKHGDQCPVEFDRRICRRRRHWTGSIRGDPQILLRRCQRDLIDDHRHGLDHRPADRTYPPSTGAGRERRMTALQAIVAGDPALILARHRALLAKPWQQRAVETAGPVLIVGVSLFSIWWLDISFGQIGPGLAALFKFISLMFPP